MEYFYFLAFVLAVGAWMSYSNSGFARNRRTAKVVRADELAARQPVQSQEEWMENFDKWRLAPAAAKDKATRVARAKGAQRALRSGVLAPVERTIAVDGRVVEVRRK